MSNYFYKCSCGQPYRLEHEGSIPIRDKFIAKCPSCGKELSTKASSIDVTFHFDPSFKKEK
ncbi:hypothetical protein [Rossellomorea aquimaris]|uniref:Uncharacterized protein n=1 Tax=Rossellomorea aquimaris TaxID=189382 RepID=A0A5D4TJQ4_9BACI|nr:hypothetical protein [Rossellomorea aquimaris]TYS75917.1 hypothetical protein FZD05_19525 [Rossellomorea aquimaris]TYS81178.1 hypothetical protein FZC85_20105 [Rossellomorea aquimaris]